MITHRNRNRIAVAAGLLALALAHAASAVDLRDWGRKFPASQRFVVLSQFGNQAVLDKETQLVWQRTPGSSKTLWGSAQEACASLVIGDRRGWRLPSVHELSSLTNPGTNVGVLSLPSGHPFQNVPLGRYWTASVHRFSTAGHSQFAYVIDFGSSGVIVNVRPELGFAHNLWCVRGGGPIGEQ